MRAWCLARARAAWAALRAPPADRGPPEIVPHEAAGLERWARADAALLLQDKPRPPAPPFLLCEPAAAGDLADQLKARPGLLLCAEGAAVLRGAAAPAAGALLRDLWDAGAFVHGRGRKAERLWGRRLTLHAVLSPDDAHALLRDPRAAREGLFARFLVAAPASRIGLRAWREPADDPALAAFGRRIGALIDPAAGPPADVGEVQTRTVGFAPAARARWIAFAGEMENRAAPGGDYAHLRPLASRLPQHAARLAALLAGFADIDAADIGEGWAEAGIALARYYGAEARRLADAAGPDGAAEVLAWLRRTRADRPFALADVCRAGPPRVRRVAAARAVVTALEARGHVRPVRDARLPPPAWELVA
jgi:hypothetical protein